MNYIFNVEYFKDIENLLEEQKRIKQEDTEDTTVINEIRQRNKAIEKFVFPGNILFDAGLNNVVDGWHYQSFTLCTEYPDLFDVLGLKDNILEGNDIFLGAFPDLKDKPGGIMKMDYITPHKELEFNEPNPISMIKIKPDVPIIFNFLLTDYTKDDEKIIVISAEEKKKLFKNIIIDMEIGAKTNVGFGRLK